MRNKKRDPNYFAFVPQKEKIQQDMEKRALDKILKRLVNEDFIWYGQAELPVMKSRDEPSKVLEEDWGVAVQPASRTAFGKRRLVLGFLIYGSESVTMLPFEIIVSDQTSYDEIYRASLHISSRFFPFSLISFKS